jgi:hypothetical protein
LLQDVFEDPEFFEDGASANDIRQGNVGDCWFLAALTALSGNPALIERLGVARDEKVGVYGFVFFRGLSIHDLKLSQYANIAIRWRMDIRNC